MQETTRRPAAASSAQERREAQSVEIVVALAVGVAVSGSVVAIAALLVWIVAPSGALCDHLASYSFPAVVAVALASTAAVLVRARRRGL